MLPMSILRIRPWLAAIAAALALAAAPAFADTAACNAPDGSLKCGQTGKSCEDMGMSPAGFTCSQGIPCCFSLGDKQCKAYAGSSCVTAAKAGQDVKSGCPKGYSPQGISADEYKKNGYSITKDQFLLGTGTNLCRVDGNAVYVCCKQDPTQPLIGNNPPGQQNPKPGQQPGQPGQQPGQPGQQPGQPPALQSGASCPAPSTCKESCATGSGETVAATGCLFGTSDGGISSGGVCCSPPQKFAQECPTGTSCKASCGTGEKTVQTGCGISKSAGVISYSGLCCEPSPATDCQDGSACKYSCSSDEEQTSTCTLPSGPGQVDVAACCRPKQKTATELCKQAGGQCQVGSCYPGGTPTLTCDGGAMVCCTYKTKVIDAKTEACQSAGGTCSFSGCGFGAALGLKESGECAGEIGTDGKFKKQSCCLPPDAFAKSQNEACAANKGTCAAAGKACGAGTVAKGSCASVNDNGAVVASACCVPAGLGGAGTGGTGSGSGAGAGAAAGGAGFDADAAKYGFQDPLGLKGTQRLPQLVQRLITNGMPYVGAIFFVVIIYSGVQYITAGGDKKQIEGAKSMLQRAFIGLLIVFFAFAIVSTVVNLLAQVATGSGGQTVQ